MEYTHLGRTAFASPAGARTMNFGPETTSPTRTGSWTGARARINFFDTANVYGWGENAAAPSRSRHLARPGRRAAGPDRDRHQVYGGMATGWPKYDKLSALNIRRACEASLKRLQTDHIDLYRCTTSTSTPRGTRSGSDGHPGQAGQILYVGSSTSPAGSSPGPTRPPPAATRTAGHEQSIYNLPPARSRGLVTALRVRAGRDPVEPAARRLLGACAQGAGGQPAHPGRAKETWRLTGPDRRVRGPLRELGEERRTWRWLVLTRPAVTGRSRAQDHRAARRRAAGAGASWRTRCWPAG